MLGGFIVTISIPSSSVIDIPTSFLRSSSENKYCFLKLTNGSYYERILTLKLWNYMNQVFINEIPKFEIN